MSPLFPRPIASRPLLLLLSLAAPLVGQQPTRNVDAVVPRAEVQAMAAGIDRLLEQALDRAGQPAHPPVDDATFLRRAYLGIVGRIPSLTESQAFLEDRRADKRARLVDQLLDSPGRTSHEFNWWADLLRARTRLMRQISGEPFMHWLKQSLQDDVPYDRMVREMLTATGPALEPGNGATGYLLRDLNMPHDSMSNTLRVFLGTRLECAQCHNHPTDKWTQLDFYRIAAFQGGMQYRADLAGTEAGRELRNQVARLGRELGPGAQQAARQMLQQLTAGITGTGVGLERLPRDYQYKDARPNQIVAAKALLGPEANLKVAVPAEPRRGRPAARGRPAGGDGRVAAAEVDSRGAFADWLTGADNPRFARVIANRIWQRTFGRGLIEPVDDLRDDTQAAIPELMTHLELLIVQLGFDLRQFQRVLMHTRLFQRESGGRDLAEGEVWLFPGPRLRRMSAEQLWDSLLTLVVGAPDGALRPADGRAQEVYRRYQEVMAMTPDQLRENLQEAALRYTDPQRFQQLQREKRLAEARERQAEQAERNRAAQPLLRQLAQARRRGDQPAIARLTAQLRELGVGVPGDRRGSGTELARASDLQQPAPPGHLLRQFGQSDRETLDAANDAASVPQVLTLMNGFLDQRIWPAQQSALRAALDGRRGADDRVRAAFLVLLGREPTAAERTDWRRTLQSGGDDGLRDLVWVLFNSHEFRFVR